MDNETNKRMVAVILKIARHVEQLDKAFEYLETHLQGKAKTTRKFAPTPLRYYSIKKELETGESDD